MMPQVNVTLQPATGPEGLGAALQILLLLTVLSLAPALLVMMTGFTRIVVALSFLRGALGTQQAPPNQVLVGLALFLTVFVMAPVWQQVYQDAWIPYRDGRIGQVEALHGRRNRCGSSCSAIPGNGTWPCSWNCRGGGRWRRPSRSRPTC